MTKAEKAWIDWIVDYGCVICRNQPEVHHVLFAGMRKDHLHTIPLCPTHHRGGINEVYAVSRHPWKREFERRYGTELELLDNLRRKHEGLR